MSEIGNLESVVELVYYEKGVTYLAFAFPA